MIFAVEELGTFFQEKLDLHMTIASETSALGMSCFRFETLMGLKNRQTLSRASHVLGSINSL